MGLVMVLLCFMQSTVQGQIPAQISLDRDYTAATRTIEISWAADDEINWHREHDDRLSFMSLRANMPSSVISSPGLTAFKFDVDRNVRLELLVDIESIHPDEEVYLRDDRTQQIIMDLGQMDRSRILSPAFDPTVTSLIWHSPGQEAGRSVFTIRNIYLDEDGDRSLDIGFGTALPCHPNAACKTDSLQQLIAHSAVRMRLVMEEGIGWCTGAFVNTTRKDRTPYLLSAYHCQFDYTPLYDMWRFDFAYASTTCANPANEPAFFSMTGCERIAGGQASDFLLVRLNEALPANAQVTFAGWNRDDVEIPDTVYHVHHPNADIRKFSTCTTGIVVHPNQIGWSEGYTTPANHHLRFKFTEGGHEPGSSGGPVFSSAGLLVGQLHGGTSGCEAVNSTFVGRFSKSWDLGPTPQERLRDWLDPDQTGALTLESTENFSAQDVVDIQGMITDPFGRPIKDVVVQVEGALETTMTTGTDGRFTLTGINRHGTYTLTPLKVINPSNGCNALDLVSMQKHLLAKDTFDFPWQHVAADPTNSNTITVGDIVMLQKLLLGKTQHFPTSPSWRFLPQTVTLQSLPPGVPVQVQITGIKIGDVNGTSDPGQ